MEFSFSGPCLPPLTTRWAPLGVHQHRHTTGQTLNCASVQACSRLLPCVLCYQSASLRHFSNFFSSYCVISLLHFPPCHVSFSFHFLPRHVLHYIFDSYCDAPVCFVSFVVLRSFLSYLISHCLIFVSACFLLPYPVLLPACFISFCGTRMAVCLSCWSSALFLNPSFYLPRCFIFIFRSASVQ
jgi:hypothetical protein